MKRLLFLLMGVLSVVLMTACGPSANKTLVLDIGGACETCPVERLDSVLKTFEGYVSHKYDKDKGTLTVEMDTTLTPARSLAEALTDNGYEVSSKEFSILLPTEKNKDACCTAQSLDPDLDPEDEADQMVNELDNETDDLAGSADDDLDNLDLEKVSSKETKKENLLEESDLDLNDDEVTENQFKDNKKKKN